MPPETLGAPPDLLGGSVLVTSLRSANVVRRVGRVVRVVGQIIESEGPNVSLGKVCTRWSTLPSVCSQISGPVVS